MLNTHTTQVHARCPHQFTWDYYEVEVLTDGLLLCEDLQAACDQLRGQKLTQEELTAQLMDLLEKKLPPGSEIALTLTGRHGQSSDLRTEDERTVRAVQPEATKPGEIRCPQCGCTDVTKFRYVEDVQNYREVSGYDPVTGLLMIYSQSDSGGSDDGDNPRLECHNHVGGACCLEEFTVPAGVLPDFS